ncbi:MAG: hypothetical protein ACOYMN_05005 [Roseimicrobium sp.]
MSSSVTRRQQRRLPLSWGGLFLSLALSLPLPPTSAIAQAPAAQSRTWTDAQGRTMQATLVRIEGTNAVFQMANGQALTFPVAKLSAADQSFINTTTTTPPTASAAAPRPQAKRAWPASVEVPIRSIEISAIEEEALAKRCIYRSEAFEFLAQDKLAGSVMKEIARTFEATRALLMALPWGIDPKPPVDAGRFQAKFYETRTSYIAEGAPPNSGGVYMSRDRTFRIPFQSLGLVMRGKTWYKDENYTNDTIIHEITHQLMHDYLAFLPMWVIEGSAEYTEMLPYKAGVFQCAAHERGIKEYIRQADAQDVTPADINIVTHLKMTEEDWGNIASQSSSGQFRLYFGSCLLVYYFCHLDGDGQGTRFIKYLDKMAEARQAWNTFFANPLVKHDKETGRYSWPSDKVTAPQQPQDDDYGLSELGLLLEGRSPEQLETDVKAGFKRIGVKW